MVSVVFITMDGTGVTVPFRNAINFADSESNGQDLVLIRHFPGPISIAPPDSRDFARLLVQWVILSNVFYTGFTVDHEGRETQCCVPDRICRF